MPSHCCVPQCTTRGYREENGAKISFYTFPSDPGQKKKWIHAIRRDEGPHFKVTKGTVVCSQHFRENDFKKTLAGKHLLKPGVVPSVFTWIRTSPRKRKAPAERLFVDKRVDDCSESIDNSEGDIVILQEQEIHEFVEQPQRFVDVGTQTDFTEYEVYLSEVVTQHVQKINDIQRQLEELKLKEEDTKRRLESVQNRLFTLDTIKSKSPDALAFYTGFQSWDAFMAIYKYLDPGERGEKINYWLSGNTDDSANYDDNNSEQSLSKKGRARSLQPIEEYFLVLCRLRQGFHEDHLAHLFNISTSTVSRIFITWINFMYLRLGEVNIWKSREAIDLSMPEAFKAKYKSTRVIIDCTEVKCQMPSSLHLNGELFSSYKHHTTLKALVGISPGAPLPLSASYTLVVYLTEKL